MLTYSQRAALSHHPLAKKLFTLMEEKQTNLSVAADLKTSREILECADHVGPYICVFKTHIDICENFSPDLTAQLQKLAEKHRFVIFEDRKFADIGNTVVQQYGGGVYKIADWAPITNAHIVPGEGIIQGLAKVGQPKGNGLLLLAEMSSKGTLATGEYTQKAIVWARQHRDFVMGFICTRKLTDDPEFIHMMPGVKLGDSGDALGQQYLTPKRAIGERGADIVIVGRGVTESKDPRAEAKRYREAAWTAYSSRCACPYPAHFNDENDTTI